MKTFHRCASALLLFLASACTSDQTTEDPGPRDTRAPEFDGATSADRLEGGSVIVGWETPAEDDTSRAERIVYRLYVGVGEAEIDYAKHVAVSPAGARQVAVNDLPEGVALRFVVRAVDEAGNEDEGTKAVELTLPDTFHPQFGGATEVVGLSRSEVEVRWEEATDLVGVDHYLVYLSLTPTPLLEDPIEVDAGETSLVIESLDEATTYYAAVRAVDGAGQDDRNRKTATGATLDETAPDFEGLDGAVAGGTDVRLEWDAGSDNVTPAEEITYLIFAGPVGDVDFDEPYATVVGQTTTVVHELDPSTNYSFVVRARDAAGNVELNGVTLDATTGASTDETPPSFAGASDAEPESSTSIRITWNAATDDLTPQSAIVYDIWLSLSPGGQAFTNPPDHTTAPGATEFTVPNLDPTTVYYAVVRARDIVGLSDGNTNEVGAATKTDDDAPLFAGITSIEGLSATAIRVNWQAAVDGFPASELVYDVYLATTSGGQNFSSPSQSVTGGLAATFTGLTRDTAYYAVVRVRDPDGNTNADTVEATGSTLPDTTAPILSTAPTVSATSETSISVSWPAATDDTYPAGQLRYRVDYRPSSSGTWTNHGLTAAGVTTRSITGLSVATLYYVRIVPQDGVPNVGSPSPTGSVTTSSDTAPPTFSGTPVLSATSTASYNSVTVDWNGATISDNITPVGSIFYEVCLATNATACSTSFSVYATTAAGVESATIGSLPLDTRYYFTVRAVDQAGNRTALSAVTDTTSPTGPTAPSVTTYANSYLQVTWSPTTDAVFSSLRYSLEIWRRTWNGSSCASAAQVAASYTTPRTTGTTAYVKLHYGDNYARIIAIDGFGNQAASGWTYLSATSAAIATGVLNPLWTASCSGSGCHGGAGGAYAAWTTTSAQAAPSPVGYATAAIDNVAAYTLADSRMYQRIISTTASRMPPGGPAPGELICDLGPWILDGSP